MPFNLRHIRVKKRLTQTALAHKIGIPRTSLVELEEGKRFAKSYHLLEQLAQALGVPIDRLFTSDSPSPRPARQRPPEPPGLEEEADTPYPDEPPEPAPLWSPEEGYDDPYPTEDAGVPPSTPTPVIAPCLTCGHPWTDHLTHGDTLLLASCLHPGCRCRAYQGGT
jgi:transcriptional regulator with XRE-family HTH domain